MGKVTGSDSISFRAGLDISEVIKGREQLKKEFAEIMKMGGVAPKGFEVKPLTEYQAGLLKIKQESLELAKAKAEQATADKAASLVTQAALKEEARLRREQLALEKTSKRSVQVSNSQSEVDAYNNTANGSKAVTSALNEQNLAQAKVASSAAAVITTTKESTNANKSNILTKIQAAKLLAEEKYIQAQATRELKNNIREQLNAKGSLEQRRAALIRLQTAYDRLSASERNSASGQRLGGIVSRVTEQVKGLETATGRAQRNVGNYMSAFTGGLSNVWAGLSKIAQIIPGLGIGGIFIAGFAALGFLLDRLDIFKSTLDKIDPAQKALNVSHQEAAGLMAKEGAETVLLVNKIRDNSRSMSERQSLLNDFIGKNPAVLGALNLQNIATEKGTAIINEYIAALKRKIEMQALEKGYSEALEKKADIESGKEDTNLGWLGKSLITANKVLVGFKGESIGEAIDKANARFKSSALDAQNNIIKSYEARIKTTVEGEAKILKVQDTSLAAAEAKLSQVNERLRTLQQGESDKSLKQQKAQLEKEIKQRTTALGLDTNTSAGKAAAKAQETALKRQRTLQAEIDSLTKKGIASKLDADQQEIVSVEEKYKKLRAKAIAFNNAKDSKGQKVNVSGLNAAETAEKLEITQKTEAKVLAKSLDEQAKYYSEFEDLRTKIGEQKAKERYANLIDVDKTYLESLAKQEEDLLNPGKAKGGNDSVDANPFAMKLLAERIAAAKLVQQREQDELLADFLSYQEKRKLLTEKYNKQMLLLGDDAESKALRTEQYQSELDALDDANAKKLSAFEALFEGVDRLSDENARKVVSNAEDMLNALMASGKISKELAAEIRKLLANTKQEIADRMPERIINLANQIDRVASSVSEVDEQFGKVLSTVGNIVGQVGNIKKGMNDFKTAKGSGDVFGQLSAGLGMFGAGISIFSSVAKLFDRSEQREAQAAYSRDLQNKQTEAINKALERQISLINDAYGTDRLLKYQEAQQQITKNEQEYQAKLAGRYQLTGNKTLDEALTRYNTTGNKDYLGVVKNLQDLEKFKLPTDLKELQRLLDEGKLDEGTATIVENLIKATEASAELANNLKAETIGSSLDSIADSFIGALTDGTQDFGKTFEDTIRTSILNGFKGQIIKEQLQGFYDDFAKATADNNLTEAEIAALRKTYIEASEKSKKDLEDLEKATGIDLSGKTDDKNKPTGITAEIPDKITQQTAGELAGLFRAQYDITKQISGYTLDGNKVRIDCFNIAREHLDVAIRNEQNTFRTANNTDGISGKLDKIIMNTSSQSTRSLPI